MCLVCRLGAWRAGHPGPHHFPTPIPGRTPRIRGTGIHCGELCHIVRWSSAFRWLLRRSPERHDLSPSLTRRGGKDVEYGISSLEPLGPMGASGVGWERGVRGGKTQGVSLVCVCAYGARPAGNLCGFLSFRGPPLQQPLTSLTPTPAGKPVVPNRRQTHFRLYRGFW